MTEILITAGVGLVTTIVSGWSSWVFARKKYNSEVDHNIIDNMMESLEFYEKLSNDNKARLTEVLAENQKMRSDLDELRNQVVRLAASICYNLSCEMRVREEIGKNEKDKAEQIV